MTTTILEQPDIGTATAADVSTWRIDPSHTTVEFAVRHLMIATVRGRFANVSGEIQWHADARLSSVTAQIPADSVDTAEPKRDAHLRSDDFLSVADYPTMTFVSTGVQGSDDDGWRLNGNLTIRGVTRPVALSVEPKGLARDPWGGDRAAWSASTKIDRRDFGLTWNQALETGGVLVGDQVSITIDVQAVRES